jgi:NAD(P)-dependent dehydrogenase (short-subunit alcohol dehydrogenase family)
VNRFDKRVVVVSGGEEGIGWATALAFAREQARVVAFERSRETARRFESRLSELGLEGHGLTVDVSRARDVQRGVAAVSIRFGRVDVLFNGAGIEHTASLHETAEEDWDRVLGVNLKGVFLLCRQILPVMIKAGGGTIVNLGSVSCLLGQPASAAYSASMGGLAQLTRQMAVDYAPYNIRVNCVCAGAAGSPSPEAAAGREGGLIGSRHAAARSARPEKVADSVLFLASEQASLITGVVLPVDGGYTLW